MEADFHPLLLFCVPLSLLCWVASMALVGLKQDRSFFRPLWTTLFFLTGLGTVLFVLGVLERSNPGMISQRFGAFDSGILQLLAFGLILFPVSFLVTVLRMPFRLVRWEK